MGLGVGIVGLPNIGKSTTFNALTKAGSTPLHIVGKSVAGIRFLIENGADPSIPNKRGRATIDTPKVRQI